jgi:hypothetical protein
MVHLISVTSSGFINRLRLINKIEKINLFLMIKGFQRSIHFTHLVND